MSDAIQSIALHALIRDQQQLTQTAHNLANLQTPGFKRQFNPVEARDAFDMALQSQSGKASPEPAKAVASHDLRAGALRATRNPTDLALAGPGYFELQASNGPVFTRRGDFHVDERGRLVSHQGLPVMGLAGEITCQAETVSIRGNGQVFQNDKLVAQLRVVDLVPANTSLDASGNVIHAGAPLEVPASRVAVRQGFLEASNVNTAQEMLMLSTRLRHFEGVLRMTQGRDEMLGTAIRRLGEG